MRCDCCNVPFDIEDKSGKYRSIDGTLYKAIRTCFGTYWCHRCWSKIGRKYLPRFAKTTRSMAAYVRAVEAGRIPAPFTSSRPIVQISFAEAMKCGMEGAIDR